MALLMESVAEAGMTVMLSSHIISDLVDTCDWLVTIHQGRVQVSGDIDELLATHRLLTGPREALDSLPPRLPVVAHTVNGRQASVLARVGAHRLAPVWTVNEGHGSCRSTATIRPGWRQREELAAISSSTVSATPLPRHVWCSR